MQYTEVAQGATSAIKLELVGTQLNMAVVSIKMWFNNMRAEGVYARLRVDHPYPTYMFTTTKFFWGAVSRGVHSVLVL